MTDLAPTEPSPELSFLVDELMAVNPAGHRLAQLCCLATTIDRNYLRLTRQRFLPMTDPSVEVDLWLSDLVERRGHDRISLRTDVRTMLAQSLRDERPAEFQRAWNHLRETTEAGLRAVPPVLLVAEELFFLRFLGDGAALVRQRRIFEEMTRVLADPEGTDGTVLWVEGVLAGLGPAQARRAGTLAELVEDRLEELYAPEPAHDEAELESTGSETGPRGAAADGSGIESVETGPEQLVEYPAEVGDVSVATEEYPPEDGDVADRDVNRRVRGLTEAEIEAYDVLPKDLARRVRIVRASWLPGGYAGLTIGRSIYVRAPVPADGNSMLVAHELVHVRQWDELGVFRYTFRYLIDFYRGLVRTRNWRGAYLNTSMEAEARRIAEEWRRRRTITLDPADQLDPTGSPDSTDGLGPTDAEGPSRVFVSYSRQDLSYVDALARMLESEGFDVWSDRDSFGGDDWQTAVDEALVSSGSVVVVMTPEAEESAAVRRELDLAMRLRKPIFPLLLRGDGFLSLAAIRFDDVRDGALPDTRFVEALRAATSQDEGGPSDELS
ncbi:MAG: toll/interleukin-1 receptor domain-containing protein [Acidimicrobiales bacterium]